MTNGILSTVTDMSGNRPAMCPWRAFNEPLVGRVISAYAFREHGNLTWAHPNPSKRLVDGVEHYARALSRVQYELDELERKNRERVSQSGTVRHG